MSNRLVAVFTPVENLTDPRLERTGAHDLFELVVAALCGTLAGADAWTDIERFGNERFDWLRSFLKLKSGIPSHDTFGRVFAMLDPAELVACVARWLEDIGQHIAIDVKAPRRRQRCCAVWRCRFCHRTLRCAIICDASGAARASRRRSWSECCWV